MNTVKYTAWRVSSFATAASSPRLLA